jgi:hypothetical protein
MVRIGPGLSSKMFYLSRVAFSRNIGTSIEKPLPLYLFKELKNATTIQTEKVGYCNRWLVSHFPSHLQT